MWPSLHPIANSNIGGLYRAPSSIYFLSLIYSDVLGFILIIVGGGGVDLDYFYPVSITAVGQNCRW